MLYELRTESLLKPSPEKIIFLLVKAKLTYWLPFFRWILRKQIECPKEIKLMDSNPETPDT